MDIEAQIIEAMKSRNFINFSYEGMPIRKIAPHALYISSAKNKCLDAYQFEGFSKTGNLPDWRNFKLEKIRDLQILNEKFEIAPSYKPYSKKYRNFIHKI